MRPTILANVSNDMRVAQEEIFGPVLCIIPFQSVEEAIEIANDSPYGLSGYVLGDHDEATNVAAQIRTGQVFINSAGPDFNAPFGGYKQSGNGREWGEVGFDEFLEYKSVLGARIVSAAE
jgi:aldehyde dehydrogenase (NAD+)